eukprot:comp20689_c0_seq1/m.42386 comp20689_c0_seq1/g.42386  ORF comp20689_c0_seq1/g.42386 comp20689_c0_seq1/m.42386 type:complete len:260 (-) comp20689_c0_seq1:37-816(-)
MALMENLRVEVITHQLFLWRGMQKKIEIISRETQCWTQLDSGSVVVAGSTPQVLNTVAAVQRMIDSAIFLSLPYVPKRTGLLIGKEGANTTFLRENMDVFLNVNTESYIVQLIGFDPAHVTEAVLYLERLAPRGLKRGILFVASVPYDALPPELCNEASESFMVDIVAHQPDARLTEIRGITMPLVEQAKLFLFSHLGHLSHLATDPGHYQPMAFSQQQQNSPKTPRHNHNNNNSSFEGTPKGRKNNANHGNNSGNRRR